MACALCAWAISQRGKTWSVTYCMDQEVEFSKRYVEFHSGGLRRGGGEWGVTVCLVVPTFNV